MLLVDLETFSLHVSTGVGNESSPHVVHTGGSDDV